MKENNHKRASLLLVKMRMGRCLEKKDILKFNMSRRMELFITMAFAVQPFTPASPPNILKAVLSRSK